MLGSESLQKGCMGLLGLSGVLGFRGKKHLGWGGTSLCALQKTAFAQWDMWWVTQPSHKASD